MSQVVLNPLTDESLCRRNMVTRARPKSHGPRHRQYYDHQLQKDLSRIPSPVLDHRWDTIYRCTWWNITFSLLCTLHYTEIWSRHGRGGSSPGYVFTLRFIREH